MAKQNVNPAHNRAKCFNTIWQIYDNCKSFREVQTIQSSYFSGDVKKHKND